MQNKTGKQRASKLLSMLLSIIMVFTMIPPVNIFADELPFSIEKSQYTIDEEVTVTINPNYTFSSTDWIGLYEKDTVPSGSNPAIAWWYVNDIINYYGGYTFNMVDSYLIASGQEGRYGLGEYEIYFLPNDGYGVAYEVDFTVGVEETTETLISTEKSEYKYGEDIVVDYNYPVDSSSWAWVGLYKKGEVPGEVDSIAWKYSCYLGEQFVLDGEDGLTFVYPERFIAGDYVLYVFAGESTNTAIYSSEFTVTAEVTDTVVTNPTCENDGQIVVTYSDGTTVTTTAAEDESLKALGHVYSEWTHVEDTNTHAQTCANSATEGVCEVPVITENCKWDEGSVTKEPTTEENGEMTYTCTACGNTRTEEISAKVPVGTEVVKAPTCEETGTLRTYYDAVGGDDYTDSEIPALGHDYDADDDGNDEWKHVNGTDTHKKTCVNCSAENGCPDCENAAVSEGCSFTAAPAADLSANKLTYTCSVCGGTKTEPVLSIDKEVYSYGDPINVTLNSDWKGSSAWVGLYKQGETYNPNAGGKRSIFWYYQSEQPETVNILKTRDENSRSSEYTGGNYKVVLFNNDSYTAEVAIEFSVEAVLLTTERTEPTCESDGSIYNTYNDGTDETITAAQDATLKALGHDYDVDNDGSEDWVYDGAEEKTHTKTCQNDEVLCNAAVRAVTEICTFGEAVITTEAVGTEAGIKTYTCSVCGGTYTEEYYNKVITGTEVIKDATCQEEGTLRTYYSDNTHSDSVITKLSCDFGEWTHVEGTKTHERVCMLDGTATGHKETEACEYTLTDTSNGKFTYTCSICGGSYADVILSTDKSEYKFGEAINVSFNYSSANDTWIGIYRKGDTPGTPFQEAFYWQYLSKVSSPFNMIDAKHIQTGASDIRWAQYVAGEYTVVLFSNGGYNVATSVDVTITKEETGRTVTPVTCESDGKIEITYSDGTTETITADDDNSLKSQGHSYGEWVYCKSDKTHTHTCSVCAAEDSCADCVNAVVTENCTFDDGVITKEATYEELGEITYTCSVCGGTYTEEYTDKVLINSEVIKKPTCDEDGVLGSWYEGDVYIETNIPATGHNYGEWAHVEGTNTHKRVCANDENHAETEECTGKSPVFDMAANSAIYTCSVCGGESVKPILSLNKDTYTLNDSVIVTLNKDWQGNSAWVGLYKKGEKYDPDNGGITSIYWYYQSEQPETVDILSTRNENGRSGEYELGEYKVVLFNDGGYDDQIEISFTVVEGSSDETTENTIFNVNVNGQNYNDGDNIKFGIDDVIKFTVTADGIVGRTSWVGVYNAKMDSDMEFSEDTPSNYWDWIKNINGQEINLNTKLDLTYGDYSIVIFGGNGKTDYDDVRSVITFTIEMDISDSIVVKKPTCTNYGTAYVRYEDGTYGYVPMNPLGHAAESWTFNESSHTHTGVCTREGCGKHVTENCTFDEGVVVGTSADGLTVSKRYTCSVCEGYYIDNEDIFVPADTTVKRIYGATRAETSILAADALKAELGAEKFDAVIIADGMNFADALAGSYLSVKKDAPILMYTDKTVEKLHQYINDNLTANGTIYVLGGVNAIPEAVVTGFDGFVVKRLAGATRYETNIEILKEAGVTNEEIIISTGVSFADSLSASASGKPILLVNSISEKLTDAQKAYLDTLSTSRFYIIGGEKAVPAAIENAVKEYGSVERIGGETRYETSVMVADKFISTPESIVLAYGQNFPDGLCGGPLAAKMNAPLILVEDGKEAYAAEYADVYGLESGVIFGGNGLVSDATVRNVFNMEADEEIITVTFKVVNGAIAAEFASEQLLNSGNYHEFIADDSDYTVKIAFYTNDVLGNVKFNSLQWDGTSYSVDKEFYTLSALSPYKPLVTNVVFYGDTTTYGISFTDKNNNERHFAIYLSGMDGSLVMSEY